MTAFVPYVFYVVESFRFLNIFDLRAAFFAELRFSFQFSAAGFAVQLGVHGLAAFRAEFAVGHRAAIRAGSADNRRRVGGIGHRIDCGTRWRGMNCACAHINLRRVIGLLGTFVKLVARGIGFGVSMVGGELFFVIWRAAFAQTCARVPANFRADPFAAARALVKVLLGFFDRDSESVIVGFASDGALNVVRAIACAGKNSAEDVSGGAQQVTGYACHRSLKSRHKSVAAFVAMKSELIATIRRKIVEIGGESNECHDDLLLVVDERGTVGIRCIIPARCKMRQEVFTEGKLRDLRIVLTRRKPTLYTPSRQR